MSSRNRSPQAKQEKLDQIISAGKGLIDQYGMSFSMRQLASLVDLSSVSSLYTYISGKAELWELVKRDDFTQFDNAMKARDFEFLDGRDDKNLDYKEKIERVVVQGDCFISFALEDYPRFGRMFILPTPVSDKEIEWEEDEPPTLKRLIDLVDDVLQDEEYQQQYQNTSSAIELAHSLWALVMGVAIIIRPAEFGMTTPYMEQMSEQDFRDFVLQQCRQLFYSL